MSVPILTEKEVVKEMLIAFKNSPCLWDPTHELHSKKAARLKYLKILTGIMRKMDPDATIDSVKKRIDNMKATFHRERKKAEQSKLEGDLRYVPSLWYYPYLNFLKNVNKVERKKSLSDEDAPKVKRARNKFRNSKPRNQNAISIIKERVRDFSASHHSTSQAECSADAAGRSISTQLKELPKLQRCIAEKLISDILFYAKIDQLSLDTSIDLNNSMQPQYSKRKERFHSPPDSQSQVLIESKKEEMSVEEEYLESAPSSPCDDMQTEFIEPVYSSDE